MLEVKTHISLHSHERFGKRRLRKFMRISEKLLKDSSKILQKESSDHLEFSLSIKREREHFKTVFHIHIHQTNMTQLRIYIVICEAKKYGPFISR